MYTNLVRRRWRVAVMAFIAAGFTAAGAAADYPKVSRQAPAGPMSYHVASRPDDLPIDSIMIHDTEASYEDTVSIFTAPDAKSSVQYGVSGQDNSSDPAVTQFVADKNWTHSVNNWWFNETSIGLEHIGFAVAPAGYFTQELYKRSADIVGWVVWKYHIPLDRAHILGHDNIPNSTDNPHVQHWDPGPSWDWPYFMDLVRAAYERWSDNAPPPPPEIPKQYTKPNPNIRLISVGDEFASARDWFLWTTGHHSAFTNVYADNDGRPALNTLVRGASDPSTYVPSPKIGTPPEFNQRDFSCDNFPWAIVPTDGTGAAAPFVISQVSASDLRAKAAWGQAFAVLGTKKVGGVLYDEINFNGTVGWVRDSDTSDGWGALVRFRGGNHPAALFSGPTELTHYPPPNNPPLDTQICPDNRHRFSRAGQTYVARMRRSSEGQTWYQIDYNHRVAWVPADEVTVSAPSRHRRHGRG